MNNCWNGHGATNLEHPELSSAGTMSLSDCMKLCDTTDGCDGITVSNNESSTPGFINCYRKANIDLGNCQGSFEYDTYTKNNSTPSSLRLPTA